MARYATAPRLGSATAAVAAGAATYALSQWCIAVVLARALGPEAVGTFALGSAISLPIIAVSQLALRANYLTTDIRDQPNFAEYFWLRGATTLAAFVVCLLASAAAGYRGEVAMAIAGVALGRCAESLIDIAHAPFHREMRMSALAGRVGLRAAIVFLAVVTVVLAFRSVSAAAMAFGVACVASCALDLHKLRVWERVRPNGEAIPISRLLNLARQSLPLTSVQFIVSVMGNLPRLLMETAGGRDALGQYAVIEHFVSIGTLLVNSIGQAATPMLVNLRDASDHSGRTRLTFMLIASATTLGVLGVLASIVCGDSLVLVVYGSNFSLAASFFSNLMIAALLSYVSASLGYVMTSSRQFADQLVLFIVVLTVFLLAAAVLVPSKGPQGVIISLCIANGVQLIGSAAIVFVLPFRGGKV